MAAAEAFAERKYGAGGPFNCATPGTWSDSRGFHGSAHVRGVSGAVCTRHLRQVLGERADGVHHELRFRPTTWGPDFYDRFFKPGAYLRTHAEHMKRWYDQPEKE